MKNIIIFGFILFCANTIFSASTSGTVDRVVTRRAGGYVPIPDIAVRIGGVYYYYDNQDAHMTHILSIALRAQSSGKTVYVDYTTTSGIPNRSGSGQLSTKVINDLELLD